LFNKSLSLITCENSEKQLGLGNPKKMPGLKNPEKRSRSSQICKDKGCKVLRFFVGISKGEMKRIESYLLKKSFILNVRERIVMLTI
jgi:hypothetical protein